MNWLRNFMMGRYGPDSLSLFLIVVSLVCTLTSSLFGGVLVLLLISYALWFWVIFRMLSRNLYKRREENGKFQRLRYKVTAWWRVHHERWVQRKDYKFFVCPSCKTTLRVPRGHGKIKIVCRRCGSSFTGRS